MSEGSRFSEAAGMAYECDARNKAQRRSDVNTMADPSWYGHLDRRAASVNKQSLLYNPGGEVIFWQPDAGLLHES